MPNLQKAQAAVKRTRARYRKKRTKKNYAAYTSALLALVAVGVATVVASSHTKKEARAEEEGTAHHTPNKRSKSVVDVESGFTKRRADDRRGEDVAVSNRTKRRSNKSTNEIAPVTHCRITPSTTPGTRVSSRPSTGYPIDKNMRPNVRKAFKNECQFCTIIVDTPGTQCEDCYKRREIKKGHQKYKQKQRWKQRKDKKNLK